MNFKNIIFNWQKNYNSIMMNNKYKTNMICIQKKNKEIGIKDMIIQTKKIIKNKKIIQ